MCGRVVDEPVCKDVVVVDGGLFGLLVEIEEEVVSFVCESAVRRIHGCAAEGEERRGREGE